MPSRTARVRFPSLLMLFPHLEPHRAGGAFDHAHGRLDGVAVQILHFLLGDLADLRLGDRPRDIASGGFRAAFELGRLLEEVRHRRRTQFEGKRAVGVDRDGDGDRGALFKLLGLRVERLAKLHDVEAALAERGTDRRRRISRPGRHLQLDVSGDFLCHALLLLVVRLSAAGDRLGLPRLHASYSFSTCPNSNSTGVARPKIDTATLSRERASSTSSTVPLKEANGPSDTRTCSPTSKETEGFGRSMPSCT